MNSIRELIIPSPLEAFVWFVVGFAVLVLANASRVWNYLAGISTSYLLEQSSLLGSLSSWFLRTEAKIDPRIIDFLVWVLIGSLAIGSIMMVQGWVQAAGKELTLLEYMRSPQSRSQELHTAILRVGLRVVGVVGVVVGLWLYLGLLAPDLDRIFFASAIDLANWQAFVWLLFAAAITGACIYILTIFGRLVFLRTNNFN